MSYISQITQPDGTKLRVSLRDTEANPVAVKVDGSAVTQPVSGPLTDTELRATPVPVSGTVTSTVADGLGVKVYDSIAASYTGYKFYDGKPMFIAQPYGYAVTEGDITAHSPWAKFGFNPDVDNTAEDVWELGGVYAFPAAMIQMQVVSSNAADDGSPAGTGVQKVKLYYLDNTFTEKTEEVTLDGTTPVNTVAVDIYRLNYVVATAVGTGGVAAGNIDVQSVGGGVTYARISTGFTQSRQAIYTVPVGKTLYITDALFSAGVAAAGNWVRFTFRANYDRFAAALRTFLLPYTEAVVQGGSVHMNCATPSKFIAGTDIKVGAIGDSASTNGACSVVLMGWIE